MEKYGDKEFDEVKKGATAIGLILVILCGFALFGLRIVKYNEAAYEIEFGKIKGDMKNTGIQWVGIGSLKRINNQIRNYEILIDAASSDFQDVQMELNINIEIKEDQVKNYILNYKSEADFNTYLNNKVAEKVKTIILQYNAEDILKNRIVIKDEMIESVRDIDELKYFTFNDLTIKDVEYSDEFNKILEQKAQVLQQREIILRQNENVALIKKNMDLVDINKYFRYQMIEKWDGKANLIISDSLLR